MIVTVGFAVEARGNGVAYAALGGADVAAESLVRVGFRCRPLSALHGRDVAYAALDAVCKELLRRGVRAVDVLSADAELALDLAERRSLPHALIVPYVRLRCTLNRFGTARVSGVENPAARDLTARARADVSLHVAA